MQAQTIGMLCAGALLVVIGYLTTTRERVALWGLSHGKARIWVTLLGQERALKLTRYFFGPLTCGLGLFLLLGTLLTSLR